MKINLLVWFGVFSVIIVSCNTIKTVSEGISGKVLWFEGDLMPGINKEPVEGVPVTRDIYIYSPTILHQAKETDLVFFQNIQTPLIKKVTTDKNGNFKVKLKPGSYSIFVKESGGLFANRYNEQGYINLVKVNENEVTDILIRIDYMAAY